MINYFNKFTTLILSLAIIGTVFPASASTKRYEDIQSSIVHDEIEFNENGDIILELNSDNNFGFTNSNGKTQFYDVTGNQVKSSWINSDGKWYYFDESGTMIIGWKKISDNWYYFLNDGARAKGWVKNNNEWYYLGEDGIMKSSSWVNIKGSWYHFNDDGTMDKNTVIDGYKIDSNGVGILS